MSSCTGKKQGRPGQAYLDNSADDIPGSAAKDHLGNELDDSQFNLIGVQNSAY